MSNKKYVINPLTGRTILVGGKTWKQVMRKHHMNTSEMEDCSQTGAIVTGAVVGGASGLVIGGVAGGPGGAAVGGLGGAALGAGVGYLASEKAKEECLKRNRAREVEQMKK